MDVLYDLMDENLIDSNGDRCGRVDDVVVEDGFERPAKVLALLSGGGVKSRHTWGPLHRLTLWLYRLVGVEGEIEPVCIAWDQVDRIENDVILKITADEVGLDRLNQAMAKWLIGRIPGANS